MGYVVTAQIIVNSKGKRVGYAFVEFADPCTANMVRVFWKVMIRSLIIWKLMTLYFIL